MLQLSVLILLTLTDVKALKIRLSTNGTLKEGDSVNLTCTVNCAHNSTQFVWFRNGQRLNTSGSVLHLPALTMGHSGSYSCALKTDETIRSNIISLNVVSKLAIPLISAGLIAVILAAVVYTVRSIRTGQQ